MELSGVPDPVAARRGHRRRQHRGDLPSELAPKTSAFLARALPRYVDAEAVRVVEGDGATTQDLLAQGFDHALFTGGTEIGKKIMVRRQDTDTGHPRAGRQEPQW